MTGVTVGGACRRRQRAVRRLRAEHKDDASSRPRSRAAATPSRVPPYSGYDTFTSKDGKTFAAVHDGALLVSNSEMALAPGDRRARGHGRPARRLDDLQGRDGRPARGQQRGRLRRRRPVRDASQLATSQASSRGVQAGGVSPQALDQFSSQLKGVRALAFAATPEDQGCASASRSCSRRTRPATLTSVKEFTPSLESSVSADSYVYLGFQDLGPTLKQVLTSLGASQAQLEQRSHRSRRRPASRSTTTWCRCSRASTRSRRPRAARSARSSC